MSRDTEQTAQFLNSLPFFMGLPEDEILSFIDAATINDYKKNRDLFLQGDPADRFIVILDGWVQLYRNTSEGDEAVVAIFTRGDVIGEAAVVGKANYPFSAKTAEDSRLIEIPSAFLKKRAQENAEVMERVMASMSREMNKLQLENEHLILMNAPQRVGCLLLQLSSGMLGKGGTFSFPYDKSLAAARLGMKPETFSRALAQLKPYGVTVSGPEVKIENFARLATFSCNKCSAELEDCKGAIHKTCGENCGPAQKTKTAQ